REERSTQRLFQGVHVAAHGGLGEAERAGRAGEAPLANDGQKRAIELPAGLRGGHTKTYSNDAAFGNFVSPGSGASSSLSRRHPSPRPRRIVMNRTALIIGATGGIGSETARALALAGW